MEDAREVLEQLEALERGELVRDAGQARALGAAVRRYRELAGDIEGMAIHRKYRITVTAEDIEVIIREALYDGIDHWCRRVETGGEPHGEHACQQVGMGGTLILHDMDGRRNVLTKGNFLAGLERYLEVSDMNEFIMDDDGRLAIDIGGMDGRAADHIIQYALFGEVAYERRQAWRR